MKIKLVDVKHDYQETDWGTCELCMDTDVFDYIEYKFEHVYPDHTTTYWVDGYDYIAWWGPETLPIDNIPRFAGWLQDQDFPDDFHIETDTLWELIRVYNRGSAWREGLSG